MSARTLDVICMGRAAVDLYAEQIGARLEDATSFAKYLGGSPANTAVGASRLGLRAAMLTRVGDEHNGRFVRETLASEGVDVSHVATDPSRLTALVFLGIKDRSTFPLIFYRNECADMALGRSDFDLRFIASATALLVSGTHFSQPAPRDACFAAMHLAREAGTKVALDIDYRPVLWGLTSPGMGENRFVASGEVTSKLQEAAPFCALIVGTEEEFHVAGGSEDTIEALRALRRLTPATLVVKRGPTGCAAFVGPIPANLDAGMQGAGFPVEVFNVLGAGDAFMAGFLSGWLRDAPLEECCCKANAAGALVVSRHGCAPAMPSALEMAAFLARSDWPQRLRQSVELNHLHRATTRTARRPEVLALAFDHRRQFEEIAGEGAAAASRIRAFKRLIGAGLARAARDVPGAGAIVDGLYGEEVLFDLTGTGLWLARPVEAPGRVPLAFESGANVGLALREWPAEQVAKCLAFYHPDDPADLRAAQLDRIVQLGEACIGTGHELLLEIIPAGARHPPVEDGTLARALEQIYAAGVKPDWWKLAPPESDAAWLALDAVISRHDPHCRGVLLLGLEASESELERGFALAAKHARCRGFAVGRSIFMDAARRWFKGEIGDEAAIAEVSANYSSLVALWRRHRHSTGERTTCNASAS